MPSIEVNNVGYQYLNTQSGVHDISFKISEGKIACLLGASGSGKTTLLRLIAGFIKPTYGNVLIGGDVVAGTCWLSAEKRRIGLVFQQHALFPHLNITENILFGARSRDALPKLLSDFHLTGKENSFPHQLSGGEQQRVALARALAAKPRALLMDEPFASIDNVLRRKIRTECIDVLRQAGVTTMIVTHDAVEAMDLADYIHVMDQGRLIQSGTAYGLYNNPNSLIVAGLFGEINHVTDPELIYNLTHKSSPELLLRPEALKIIDTESTISGVIKSVYFRGSHYVLHVLTKNTITLKVMAYRQGYEVGNRVFIVLA